MQTRLNLGPDTGKLSFQQTEERIRVRAFGIFEEAGHQDGHALDDWLEAKAEVLALYRCNH